MELNEEKHSVGRIEVNPIESLNCLMKEDTMKGCDNTISLRDLDIDTFCDDIDRRFVLRLKSDPS